MEDQKALQHFSYHVLDEVVEEAGVDGPQGCSIMPLLVNRGPDGRGGWSRRWKQGHRIRRLFKPLIIRGSRGRREWSRRTRKFCTASSYIVNGVKEAGRGEGGSTALQPGGIAIHLFLTVSWSKLERSG